MTTTRSIVYTSCAFLLMFVATTSLVHADSVVTITGGDVYAVAVRPVYPDHVVHATAASLFNNPTTLTATSDTTSTTAEFSFSNSGFIQEATLGLGFLAGGPNAVAFARTNAFSHTFFTVSETTTYELSGSVAINGWSRVELYSRLSEPGGTVLSYSYQMSENTANKSLVVGGSGGDTINNLTGSLTGSLVAGRTYVYTAYAQIYNRWGQHTVSPTTATSTLSLLIGDQTQPVPTPTAAMIGFTLLGGMFMKRNRRMA